MRYFLVFCFCMPLLLNAQSDTGRYTFVFLNTNPNRPELPQEQVDSLQAGHMANIGRLVDERKMIAAGPYHTGGGIFIFDTNQEETQAVLDSDPAIAAGRFQLEVYPFDMVEGEICTLWDKDESEVGMTTYQFVRFKSDMDDDQLAAAKTNRFTKTILDQIQRRERGVEVLGVLNFTENRGQVVIYKSDKEEGYPDLFAEHQLVRRGLMTIEQKKLYFAKGVFCEE